MSPVRIVRAVSSVAVALGIHMTSVAAVDIPVRQYDYAGTGNRETHPLQSDGFWITFQHIGTVVINGLYGYEMCLFEDSYCTVFPWYIKILK